MSRIFLQKNKFHQILPSLFLEGEFEDLIVLHAPNLYPEYFVIPFKIELKSPQKKVKPDLIFISRDYTDWYVVEIEMAYHSYKDHIEPQIEGLLNADYSESRIIDYIINKASGINKNNLIQLIQKEPLKLLLIVNEEVGEWEKIVKNKYNATVSIFKIFKEMVFESTDSFQDKAFEINSNYPIFSVSVTSQCSVHPFLRFLRIEDNSELKIVPDQTIYMEYDNFLTIWRGITGPEGFMYLKLDGRDDVISVKKKYKISKLRDNTLLLDVC